MDKSVNRRNSKTDESQAQNQTLKCPKLDDKLGKLRINSTLLETKEFSSIIEIIDHKNRRIKTELAKTLSADDNDYFTRIWKRPHYVKTILIDLLDEKKLNLTVQQFIELLFLLKYPQKDICYKIAKYQSSTRLMELLWQSFLILFIKEILEQHDQFIRVNSNVYDQIKKKSGIQDPKINIELDFQRGTFRFLRVSEASKTNSVS